MNNMNGSSGKQRRTKIVTTLGPATDRPGVLEELLRSGANIVRLNFSHGTAADHEQRVSAVRSLAARLGLPVGIMGDLQGPKIRIGRFAGGPVTLQIGDRLILDAGLDLGAGTREAVGLTYKELPRDLAAGDVLLLDDGRIQLQTESIDDLRVHTRVLVGGTLSDSKGINKLGGGLSAPALTDKDRADIRMASALDVDYMAVSFPRSGADLHEARRLLQAAGSQARIVAKIERAEAVASEEAMVDLITAADAVMVARGDLGVEIGDARLMEVQKKLITLARSLDRAVITATQMMESMIHAPLPTRAEVMDVSNAVLDGTDAVMLSAETASGDYPVETVRAMAQVCAGAETSVPNSRYRMERVFDSAEEVIAFSSIFAANHLRDINGLIVFTDSGRSPLLMSRLRTGLPIYAFSRHPRSVSWMCMDRGVYPFLFDNLAYPSHEELLQASVALLTGRGLVKSGDRLVSVFGVAMGHTGHTDSMRVITVS